MRNLLRKLRRNHFLNGAGRVVLKTFAKYSQAGASLQKYWPVAGTVSLRVEGTCFKAYAHGDDHIVNNLYYNPSYERHELRITRQLSRQGGAVLDIGANTGLYSLFVASCNPQASVIAFEPHPTNFARLLLNVRLNQLQSIQPVQKAVGTGEGEIDFYIPEDDSISDTSSVSQSFSEGVYNTKFKKIAVQVVSVDAFMHQLNQPVSLLKIDVEGYEYEALKGAYQTIKRHRPFILCEIFSAHCQTDELFEEYFPKVHQIQLLLEELNYRIYEVGEEQLKEIPGFNHPHESRNYLLSPRRVDENNSLFAS